MRSSRLSRLARLAQARAQQQASNSSNNGGLGLGQIKLFDIQGGNLGRIAGYSALSAAGAWWFGWGGKHAQ